MPVNALAVRHAFPNDIGAAGLTASSRQARNALIHTNPIPMRGRKFRNARCGMIKQLSIGLMSGTSRDGIDAALIETDGENYVKPLAFLDADYDGETRAAIVEACDLAMLQRTPDTHVKIDACEAKLTDLHIALVARLMAQTAISADRISVIGFHGHTVAHRVDLGWTWQIGDGQKLADALQIPVVFDLRGNDVAHGGQGAPLLPIYHRVILSDANADIAVLNLGGVANLTWLGREGQLLAFDCGMASALIDDWIAIHSDHRYDFNGVLAASGTVDKVALSRMLNDPFFAAPIPKSLDRKDFNLDAVGHLSAADGAATLTAFTAKAVAIGIDLLPARPKRLMVAGGGRKNGTMMAMIGDYSDVPVEPVDARGWDGDAIEAQGFAYMAARRLKGLPITFTETTGVALPVMGGRVAVPETKYVRRARA
jgi:anhydro-N-acetylmuramic acid kinase